MHPKGTKKVAELRVSRAKEASALCGESSPSAKE